MSPRILLVTLTLIVLALLLWQLRWVLIVFFGAIVLSVALDVLIQKLQTQIKLPRNIALLFVLLERIIILPLYNLSLTDPLTFFLF